MVVIVLLSLVWVWQQWPDGKLRVVFCDVGQGDAALVVLGSFQALIDTGSSESKLFTCLSKEMPFWDRRINLVFISHPQADHNGALKGLAFRYKIDKVVEFARENDAYRYKDLYFDILMGNEQKEQLTSSSSKEENEDSMVLLVKYFDFSALFTADIGEKTELALLDEGVLKKTTVLKVPHHGSKYSSSNSFLEKLSPKIAIVSVGAKNTFGHPNGDTLIRLDRVKAKVLRTDYSGSVEVFFDAGEIKVFTEK